MSSRSRQRTMLAIDLPSNSAQLGLQLLILLDILSTWHRNLDEYDLIPQLRMVLQKRIEGFHLLRESFDIIQTVHTDNDHDIFVFLLQCLDAFLHFRLGQRVGELLRVDTDNEFVGADESVLILDLMWDLSLSPTETGELSTASVPGRADLQ